MRNCHTESAFKNNATGYRYENYNEKMNISYFQYFSTVSLMMMCYSFINPYFIKNTLMYLTFGFANTFLSSYIFINHYIYRPYKKYIQKPLYNILNISNNNDEVQIVKDGIIIYSFKTMNDFIKNNPIKFIPYNSDSSSNSSKNDIDEEEHQENEEIPDNKGKNETDQVQIDIETSVDADLTNESVQIHEKSENDDSDNNSDDSDDSNDSENENDEESNDSESDYILDPSEYDFVIRTLYYETKDNNTVNTHSYCLKYNTFSKCDLRTSYTFEELSKEVSLRKFIGANLNFNGVKYNINLTEPSNYYIIGNSIFDYAFLKWYMSEHYDIILSKKYSISCIDNFVEMYNFTSGKKIIVEKNVLKITDDETFIYSKSNSESECDSESETESNSDSESQKNDEDKQEETINTSDTNDVEILERCD